MSERSDGINSMFSGIAGNYDRMNHLLSFGVDWAWRQNAAAKLWELVREDDARILDIAIGTGDLSFAVAKWARKGSKPHIVGIDFNREMLEVGRRKAEKESGCDIEFTYGDALAIPYEDGTFDAVVSGFALRSVDDLNKLASEIKRVLKPGGSFVLLDMAMPDGGAQRAFFSFYSVFMRVAGAFVDNKTYKWLVETIKKFDKKKLVEILKETGFKEVKIEGLTSGIAYMVYGHRE